MAHLHSPATFWNLIDAVLLINLDQRADRWQAFLESTAAIIPNEKIHRISAVFGQTLPGYGVKPWFRGRPRDLTWAARAGCILSHQRALALARDHGWNTILILEDDVAIDLSLSANLHSIAQALTRNDGAWQVCYLGYTDPVAPCRVVDAINDSHNLIEISGCTTTHAYLIKREPRGWILDHLPDHMTLWPWLARHRAIDRWYQTVLSRHFAVTCISPAVIHQQPGFSDIAQRSTDYLATGAHLLHVPSLICSPLAFIALRHLHHASSRLGQIIDAARGLAKRLRGF